MSLNIDHKHVANHIKDYSNKLKNQLEEIWTHCDTKIKFVELEDLMVSKLNSQKFIRLIYVNRILSLVITLICGYITYYFYCHKLALVKEFNCKLPQSYW